METKTVSWGPNMIQKRRFFQLGQVQPGTRTLALGGSYKGGQHGTTRMYVDTVEELVGEAWEEVGSLQVARCEHGGVTVPLSMVCAASTTYITTTTLPTTHTCEYQYAINDFSLTLFDKRILQKKSCRSQWVKGGV